ncbi:MAG: hypothetical protein AAGF11_54460 [Myxococcota bacterium]
MPAVTTTLSDLTVAISNRIADIVPTRRAEFRWLEAETLDLSTGADPRSFYIELEPGIMRPDGVLSEVIQLTTELRVHCSYHNLVPAVVRQLVESDRLQLWDVISDHIDPISGLWQGFPTDAPWEYTERSVGKLRGIHKFTLDYVIQDL